MPNYTFSFSGGGGGMVQYRVIVKNEEGRWEFYGPSFNNAQDAHYLKESRFPWMGVEGATIIQYTSEEAAQKLLEAWNSRYPPKPIEKKEDEDEERRKAENRLEFARYLYQKGIINEGA